MLQLIERIRERLTQGAYANEAAISHGVVTPILNALGWDSADPDQLVPEFALLRGRVDFALFGLGHRPAVFIEVKGIGRAMDGDRQLFEYAFHHGVPLCVLTDGREWSFYVPGGQGSYEDRRVYRLQLDDRDASACERILIRYLARDRIRDGSAFEDAQRDYRDAAGRREAVAALPQAWHALITEPEELLLDIVSDKAEALCGFKPESADVLRWLRELKSPEQPTSGRRQRAPVMPSINPADVPAEDRTISFSMLGQHYSFPTAKDAFVEILRRLASSDPARIDRLSEKVRGRTRNHIARTVAEINPARPDLARAAEIAPGWLVGLNLANRDKMAIIRTACDVYELRVPDDLDITLPNA